MNWNWKELPEELGEMLPPVQREIFDLLRAGNGSTAIARIRKSDTRNTFRLVGRIKEAMRKQGYDPESGVTRITMPPHFVKGRSELVKVSEDGSETVAMYWNKTDTSKTAASNSLLDFVEGLKHEIVPVKPTKAAKLNYRSDLMPSIFIGDAHVGMRAFGKETKHHNFDTEIAVSQLRDAVDYLTERAEPAKIGLLVDVGDYTHSDSHSNQTTAGTPLDVDTRHRSTMYQAAMTMRYMIGKMLEKCEKVNVVVARGNHNENVAPAIELMLTFYYENEPRVNILPTLGHYHYIEYGHWLIGVTHGNNQKAEALAGSMARDMAQAWGRTTHRLWATGHYHKDAVKTLPGVKHKVFAALPPPDSWHASHGFAGDGEMEMWTFRKTGGVHSTHVYNIPRPIVEPDLRIA